MGGNKLRKVIFAVGILMLCFIAAVACADVTVHFDLQGGEGGISNLRIKPDENGVVHFNIPDEKPVRSGYNFIGWYCKGLEMEQALYKPREAVAFAKSRGVITYLAQWENENHQTSCPYLIAWGMGFPQKADIIQVDFKCIQEAPHTYYAVHSWLDGYAGFQILDDGTHVVIMSLWDLDVNGGKVRPAIEYAPYSSYAGPFSGEGTGKRITSTYNWTKQRWYTMRIQARTSGAKTIYEQWIRPEDGAWEKIAAISVPLAEWGFYCDDAFLEDYWPFSNQRRSMQIRNASGRLASTGKWQTNKQYYIENFDDQNLQNHNVLYNCKADAANDYALYMQIGGSGYEKAIELPKTIQLKECDIVDQYMLD